MVNKFIKAIAGIGHSSNEFEAYCMGIQETGLEGAPTVDEARKDYQTLLLSRSRPLAS